VVRGSANTKRSGVSEVDEIFVEGDEVIAREGIMYGEEIGLERMRWKKSMKSGWCK
jgi:hypothetical protein